ncbi:MAG: protease pro-enzyme activation domain-containing protein [Actinomycetes bacterium]
MSWISRQVVLGTTAAVAVALATPLTASAGDTPPRTVLQTAPGWTAQAARVGGVPAAQQLHLTVVLALRDQAGAEALATAVSDPASAGYGKYLTAAQWRSRFAPTAQDVANVTAWLTSQGFQVGEVPANHRYVAFTGTTAQAEKAFGTQLLLFSRNGHTETAPATAVSVPSALAGTVVGIGGLDTSARAKPLHVGPADVSPAAAGPQVSSATALPPPPAAFVNATPCSTYFGEKAATAVPQPLEHPLTYAPCGYRPAQLRGAYGLDAALSSGYDGRGATVAIVDAFASPTILKDAQTYARRNDARHPLRTAQFSQSLPASYSFITECGGNSWYGEETLDVEAVHAMAPMANILYVGGSSCQNADLAAAVNTVVDNELADIISNSYGETETDSLTDPVGLVERHQTYLQAAAEGISILFSSGDNGDEIANTGTRQTDMDASDPLVTSVGGTALAIGKDNTYQFEQGWGTGKSTLTNGAWNPAWPAYLYGAGGGTSRLFKQPGYQRRGVPSSIAGYFPGGAHRAVPDVAMDADPQTGMLIGQSQTFPDGTVRYSEFRTGGTSLASPLLAGVVAVAAQVNGGKLGFLNPRLYRLEGSSALRDVNHGRAVTDGVVRVDYANRIDATGGTIVSLRTFNQTGTIYTRPGYDDVTGVGTPNGIDFLKGLSG